MSLLRALWRDDRPICVSLIVLVVYCLAVGLFLPLPAGAATGDPVETLERDAWVWMGIAVAVVGVFVLGCWLIDWTTARRDRRSHASLEAERPLTVLLLDDERWAQGELYPQHTSARCGSRGLDQQPIRSRR